MRKKLIIFSSFSCLVLGWMVLANRTSFRENEQEAPHLKSYKASSNHLGEKQDIVSKEQASIVSVDRILSKEMTKLAKELRVDEDESYRLKELNNFRTPLKDIIERVEPVEYAQFLQETMKKLQSCLVEDFCGMEKDHPDSAYFDETNTTAHKTLKRSLEALRLLLEKEGVKNRIDRSVLERLLENNNGEIQEKAMELIRKTAAQRDAFQIFVDAQDFFKGYSKAAYFRELSLITETPQEQETFDFQLARSFAEDDPHTVISILESLPEYSVSKERFDEVAQSLCHYTQEQAAAHNKLEVQHNLRKLKEKEILTTDFECL